MCEATLSDAEADAITDRMAFPSAEASRRNLIGELESRMRCATAARTNAARDSYLVQMTLAQLSISRARYALRGAVGGRYTRQLVERVAQVLEGGLLATDQAIRLILQMGDASEGEEGLPPHVAPHLALIVKLRSGVMCELAALAGEESQVTSPGAWIGTLSS